MYCADGLHYISNSNDAVQSCSWDKDIGDTQHSNIKQVEKTLSTGSKRPSSISIKYAEAIILLYSHQIQNNNYNFSFTIALNIVHMEKTFSKHQYCLM